MSEVLTRVLGRAVVEVDGDLITVERIESHSPHYKSFNVSGLGAKFPVIVYDGEDWLTYHLPWVLPLKAHDAIGAAVWAIITGNPCQDGFTMESLALRGT